MPRFGLVLVVLTVIVVLMASPARGLAADAPRAEATVQFVQGLTVEVIRAGATTGDPLQPNAVLRAGDTLRTGEHSEATLALSDGTILSVGELATVEIQGADTSVMVNLVQGILSFFHRDRPGSFRVRRGTTVAIVRGTEFVFAAAPNDGVVMTLFDGEVIFPDQQGGDYTVNALPGAPIRVTVVPGQPPHQTAVLASEAIEAIQWLLYYPGILDLRDLQLSAESRSALVESIQLYEQGDLLGALKRYPAGRNAADADEALFHAAVLLSVGDVPSTLQLLATLPQEDRIQRLANALRQLIAAVQLRACTDDSGRTHLLTTEWMARSYCLQASAQLSEAREAARAATVSSPEFGFAWARLAELEFSFGDLRAVEKALAHAQILSPRNAEVFVLNGFLLAARRESRKAEEQFNRAIALDPGLGNAWLGRGLMRIQLGDKAQGRTDIMIAASKEPQRALLRSYLGKAYSAEGDYGKAFHEYSLAKSADPKDPTAWFYSALDLDAMNRVNEAIEELEKAQELGDNEAIFRSSTMLDQDEAVRSANLARIYRKANMVDVSYREAVKAVNADYTSYSSHLFLANTYDYLRDPNLVDLRYETAAVSEYLIANILAPVDAGILSPSISQGNYSKLFERNRVGVVSLTEYGSDSNWLETGSVYGTVDNSSFALEGFYRKLDGFRANNDSEQRQVALTFKQQITAHDTILLRVASSAVNAGDLSRSVDDITSSGQFRAQEDQNPQVSLGYHHEWSPESHTLFFAQGIHQSARYSEPNQTRPALALALVEGSPIYFMDLQLGESYEASQRGYAVELQQLWRNETWTLIGGTRFQWGQLEVAATQSQPASVEAYFSDPAYSGSADPSYLRGSAYAYAFWQILDPLRLIGGLSYDYLKQPDDFRSPPVTSTQSETVSLNPKAGFMWSVTPTTMFRAAYTRSITGIAPDQSFQIEPTQVAGFTQLYRSAVPEYLVGATEGAPVQTAGFSLEHRFPTQTYVALGGDWLQTNPERYRGGYTFDYASSDLASPTQFLERIDYTERGLTATLNQLIGKGLAFGVRYRVSRAAIETSYPDQPLPLVVAESVAAGVPEEVPLQQEALLQLLDLTATYNHSSGLFATVQGLWNGQTLLTGEHSFDQFWQLNLLLGYRFMGNHGEIAAGILNATDQEQFLVPIASYNIPPRDRMYTARLLFSF